MKDKGLEFRFEILDEGLGLRVEVWSMGLMRVEVSHNLIFGVKGLRV